MVVKHVRRKVVLLFKNKKPRAVHLHLTKTEASKLKKTGHLAKHHVHRAIKRTIKKQNTR